MTTKINDLGIQRVVWADLDGLADRNKPTLAELAAAFDLTDLLLDSYTVDFTASDKVSERGLSEKTNSSVLTVGNYEGMLETFRSYTDGKKDAGDITAVFKPGTKPFGYIIRRVGPDSEVPFAVGDEVEVWKFQADQPQLKGGTNVGFLKAKIPLSPQGWVNTEAVVAAA